MGMLRLFGGMPPAHHNDHQYRVLAVSHDTRLRLRTRRAAYRLGFQLLEAQHLGEVRQSLRFFQPNAVMLDLSNPLVEPRRVIEAVSHRLLPPVFVLAGGAGPGQRHMAEDMIDALGLVRLPTLNGAPSTRLLSKALADSILAGNNEMEEEFLEALETAQLVLDYQPQMSAPERGLVGLEGLVRWHHPKRGKLGADVVIPLADRTDRRRELTHRVIDVAVKDAMRLKTAGIDGWVSINAWPSVLRDDDLAGFIETCCAEANLSTKSVQLEVTEDGLLSDDAEFREQAEKLRNRGISISLDDFGTGEGSLIALHRLPFNEVKIDQSFVADVDANADTEGLLRDLIHLCHNLNYRVCGEGVETTGQADCLRGIGCDTLQGFLLGRPDAFCRTMRALDIDLAPA